MKPPANASPAPVGSKTDSSGYAGTKKNWPFDTITAPVLAPLDDDRPRAELQDLGGDVRQEQERRLLERARQHRFKVGEHVELGIDRPGLVEVEAVLADPAKGSPAGGLEARHVDAALLEEPEVLLREVVADGRDEPDGRKEARRVGKIGRRAPQHLP